MDVKDFILSTCAVLGAGLGVYNLVRSLRSDSEQVTVSEIEGDSQSHPAVEIVNRSGFPVTIIEIGTVSEGTASRIGIERRFSDTDSLPKRIDARDAYRFRLNMHDTISRVVHRPDYTYALTALGEVFTNEGQWARRWRRVKEFVKVMQKVN